MSNPYLTAKQRRHEVRKELRRLNSEIGLSAGTAEQRQQWQALTDEIERLDDKILSVESAELGGRMDGTIAMRGNEPVNPYGRRHMAISHSPRDGESWQSDAEERERRRLFLRAVRTGDPGAEAELRAYNDVDMIVGTDAEGGYAVPTGLVRQIKARRDEQMLANKLGCSTVPGKGTTVNWPVDNEADVIFTSVNEASAISQDSPDLSTKAFTLVKYAKYVTLSWELLRDEDAALEEFIQDWTARGWAATHNSLLVTEVLANGTAGLTLDAAAAIGAAEIPEFVGKLAPEYQPGAQWMMHPTTFSYIQGLNATSQFLFSPTPGGDPNGKLWGYPLQQTSYMTALQASAKSMVFGNFSYLGKREVMPLTVLRDPYSDAVNGRVRLWFWFDAVYGVLQSEAIQYASHPTA